MRKCDSCGYLVLGDGDNCNHCGAALSTALAGATLAAAPASPAASRPAPPTAPPQPAVWGERPAQPQGPRFAPAPPAAPPEPPREFWSPPPPAIPTPRRTPPGLGRALLVAVLVVAGVVGYKVYSGRPSVPAGTGDFVAGHGVEFTAADGSFQAKFPNAPKVNDHPITVQQYRANILLASDSTDDYEMGAASMSMPINVPAYRADELLDDALKGGIDESDGKLVSKTHFTRGGYRAL